MGCGPHPATFDLPTRLASASATRTCTTGPLGVAAAAHSALHCDSLSCDIKEYGTIWLTILYCCIYPSLSSEDLGRYSMDLGGYSMDLGDSMDLGVTRWI